MEETNNMVYFDFWNYKEAFKIWKREYNKRGDNLHFLVDTTTVLSGYWITYLGDYKAPERWKRYTNEEVLELEQSILKAKENKEDKQYFIRPFLDEKERESNSTN